MYKFAGNKIQSIDFLKGFPSFPSWFLIFSLYLVNAVLKEKEIFISVTPRDGQKYLKSFTPNEWISNVLCVMGAVNPQYVERIPNELIVAILILLLMLSCLKP